MPRPPNEEFEADGASAGSGWLAALLCRLLYERRGSTRTLRLDGRS